MTAMHGGGLVAAALVAGGCFGKPDFSGVPGDARLDSGGGHDDAAGDAPVPDGCVGAWGQPMLRHELDGLVAGEPTITADLQTLYFAKQITGTSWEIHWADRGDATSAFTPRGRAPFDLNGSAHDQDPSVTDDGLMVIFRDGPSGSIKQAVFSGTWTVTNVPGLDALAPSSLELSGDGLTFYWSTNGTLHIARRGTRTTAFVEDPATFGSNIHWPTVTGDGLHLYYTMLPSTYGVYEATRTTPTAAFAGSTMLLGSSYHDPDVTSDGAVMIVGERLDTTVAIMRRDCP